MRLDSAVAVAEAGAEALEVSKPQRSQRQHLQPLR